MGSDSVTKAANAETGEESGGFYWKQAHGINLHKGCSGPAVFALMIWYDCYTPAAWTYLALHGSYGLLWLGKELVYPDKNFQGRVPFWMPIAIFIYCLFLYWSVPWMLVTAARSVPLWYQCVAIAMFSVGVFLMQGADCQKAFTLKHAPGKLITDGFFKHIRHPNYLGELMIYSSFGMLPYTARGFVPVIFATSFMLLPNTFKIDRSLSRYPEFAAWKASTYHILPFLY